MARAGCRTNGLQKIEGDDVEKSLELLDKVLSEFEDPDSLPHIEPESPSQGNQSEDDGYMSMNGRRAKVPPDFYHHHQQQHQQQDQQQLFQTESKSSASSPPILMGPLPVHPSTETTPEETKSSSSSSSPPPPPQVAEAIISNLLPRTSPTTASKLTTIGNDLKAEDYDRINNAKNRQKRLLGEDASKSVDETDVNIIRKNDETSNNYDDDNDSNNGTTDPTTTLPKTRPTTVIPSRYSSLPCNGPIRGSSFSGSFDGSRGMKSAMGSGSFDGGRNILGIGISAVHDAVLRGGVAKLPEPIVNEHPVTIYPGRASPPRSRLPPRTLPGSIERHREVCRNLNSSNTSIATTTTSTITTTISDGGKYRQNNDQIDNQLISPLQRLAISKSPSSPIVSGQNQQSYKNHQSHKQHQQQNEHHFFIHNSNSFNSSSNHLVDNKNLLNNLVIPARKRNASEGVQNSMKQGSNSDSEEFSDDSLEGQSLPPPPPPPVVPPPPSLSAPVTPSKRGSIAWEINLDDHLPPPPPLQQSHHQNNAIHSAKKKKNKEKTSKQETSPSSPSSKIIIRRRGRSVSGSQSSLISTPGNSIGSLSNHHSPQHNNKLRNRASSVEWPEPPDPPLCSTEDEAASLYSDSDEIIPAYPTNLTGQGTYVIRKGRRERQRLPELNISMSSSINSRLSSEGNLGHLQSNNLLTPSSRHSIDLGSSSHISIQNPILSPRSRLSLDLSSPNSTSEFPQQSATLSNVIGGGGITTTGNVTISNTPQQQQQITNISPCYSEFKSYVTSTANVNALQINESNGNGSKSVQMTSHGSNTSLNNNINNNGINGNSNSNVNGSLTRSSPLPPIGQQQSQSEVITTPRRELAPPIEEDEEQDSESQHGAPLRQIENNISALLRGDISIARVGDIAHARRPLGFRPGVHKSESAKEMLLSQANAFGPLPPSPQTSSPEPETDGFPPLPPSPQENVADDEDEPDDDVLRGMHGIRINSRTRLKNDILQFSREEHPPTVPPHRGTPSLNTLKTRSMDAGYTKKYSSHGNSPGTLPCEFPGTNTRRRLMSGAFPKRSAQSPREERRLQTSCSLPETPIFARGCDIPRTPHRRAPEVPASGSRTAPRTNATTNNTLNSSIVGIGSTLGGGRQRSINQALASGEMLRLAGGPARGWYPKQRNQRPASTEHLDRLHRSQGSMRAWDMGGMHGTGGNRKPLTLPPNLTPKFFNKSPREALRRVTSLLIRKGNGKDKESKREKEAYMTSAVHRSPGSAGDIPIGQTSIADTTSTNNHQHKKKGFFKSFWKKSKHYSLDQ